MTLKDRIKKRINSEDVRATNCKGYCYSFEPFTKFVRTLGDRTGRRFAYFLLMALTISLSAQMVFADERILPANDPPDLERLQVVTHQMQVSKAVNNAESGLSSPDGSLQQSWTVEWANAAGYTTGLFGAKYVRHEHGRTRKVAGPAGSYQAGVHATLIDGPHYGGTQVFSYITHPCAEAIVNNATAQSCSSPWQSSSTGRQWYIISGHHFDIGITGSHDLTCPGCIDWVYTTP